jgi:DNA polymerase-3 subunit delta
MPVLEEVCGHTESGMMLYILYGDDDFSIHETLEQMKTLVGLSEVLDANVTRAHVTSLSPSQLIALCSTVPFLAERRMVIVDGLLTLFEDRRPPRGSRSEDNASSEWLSIAEHIPTLPLSTDLVLVDGVIGRGNGMLRRLAPLGQVKECPSLKGADLHRWVLERAADRGCTISGRGVELLADMVGGNLWSMNSEIEKLSLYCHGRTVEAEDVQLLVSIAREMTIFNAVDAIVEERFAEALRIIKRLMEGGADGPGIVRMVARQVRLLLLAKDMERKRIPQEKMGERLGLRRDWMVRRVRGQGRRYSQAALKSLLQGLLETDRAIKTGRIAEHAVGEFLLEVFTRVASAQRTAR